MDHQKHFFSIPDHITYLNGAYMSPSLKTVEEAGIRGLKRKSLPFEITDIDFFKERTLLKQAFAKLIHADDHEFTAIIPSVSYGIANAANNIDFKEGDEILVVQEQFPSNVYNWQHIAEEKKLTIKTVNPPETFKDRGQLWNRYLLEAIGPKTKVVTLPQVHWADGTVFDLKAIRQKSREFDALLVIDGTQSVGAFPFSIKEIDPDALICGGYKWLLGPYSLGMAYYGSYFHNGNPIEHNWMNRKDSEDFSRLVNYNNEYQPKAGRFSVGESSNFALTPMLIKAIEQLIEWKPENIQEYGRSISGEAVAALRELGCFIEEDNSRAHHLFGVFPPEGLDINKLKAAFKEENIFVSYRGDAIRISLHLYNTAEDLNKLVRILKNTLGS